MVSKTILLVIVVILLTGWLLVSSIHLIVPQASGGTAGTGPYISGPTYLSNPGNGGANAGGGGNNGGTGNGGGLGSFPGWGIRFPSWNWSIKLPNWNLSLPNWNITWPRLHIKWPNFNWTLPNLLGGGNGTGFGGGGGGGSGNSGSGGTGVDPSVTTTATKVQTHPFTIPPQLLLIVVVIIIILASIGFLARGGRLGLPRRQKAVSQTVQELIPVAEVATTPDDAGILQNELVLEGEEVILGFAGWDAKASFIKPLIKEELPLIWSLDEPLIVNLPSDAHFICTPADSKIERSADGRIAKVTFGEKCNLLAGAFQGQKDLKWIRAVHYNEDVVKLFRLNLVEPTGKDISPSVTAREISDEMLRVHPELVKDLKAISGITRVFERAFYGKKEIPRHEYESFLLNLRDGLSNPKVIICGPRNSGSAESTGQ